MGNDWTMFRCLESLVGTRKVWMMAPNGRNSKSASSGILRLVLIVRLKSRGRRGEVYQRLQNHRNEYSLTMGYLVSSHEEG